MIPRVVDVAPLSAEAVKEITEVVFMPHTAGPSEALLIFGTVQADWEGLATAILRGDYERVVLAGRFWPQYAATLEPISHRMARTLAEFGVPTEKLLIQDESDHTLDDVRLSVELIGRVQSLCFAAKSHHSGRCARTLRQFFPSATLLCHTHAARYGDVLVDAGHWADHPLSRGTVVGEYQRILTYSARGDIAVYP